MACSNSSSCNGDVDGLLTSILNQDRAIFDRWAQVGTALGVVVTGGLADSSSDACSNSETALLRAILAQRQAIFDRIYQLI